MKAALYVHLPFCVKKCEYCDFVSYAGKLGKADEYIDAVLNEAKTRKAEYGLTSLTSAYFGGGTPSLLSASQFTRLTEGLYSLFRPEEGAEITVEVNPGAVSREFLAACKAAKVNRVSLGVQAYQERLLRLLGRIHTFEDAKRTVELIGEAGIGNLSCDAMFALPDQTVGELLETLGALTELNIKHISCYSLILEENTPLYRKVAEGRLSLPDEETCREMQLKAVGFLQDRGFERYEISNYALKGFESKHNTAYWTGGDYLGLGCAAHSYMKGERFSNPPLDEYLSGKNKTDVQIVDAQGRLEETVLLQTRLTRGIDLDAFRRAFGGANLRQLLRNAAKYPNYTEVSGDCLRLNPEGLMVQNALVLELLSGLSA